MGDKSSLRRVGAGGKGPGMAAPPLRCVASSVPETPSQQRDDLRIGGGALLVLAGAALIAWSTLRPHAGGFGATASAAWSLLDALLNLLLFLPLGAGLALLGLRFRRVVVVGVLASAAIELAQHFVVQGRFGSLADVAANACGIALGALVVLRWGLRLRWWRWVAPVIVATVLLTWVIGGYLAQPAVPPQAAWHVEMRPSDVLEARLQGVPLPAGEVADVRQLRALLSASHVIRQTLTVVSPAAPAHPTRLFAIEIGGGRRAFIDMVQEGTTLRAWQRTGLSWVGLPGPWLALRNALPSEAGDTVYVRLEATRRHLLLSTTTHGVERTTSIRLSPELYAMALFARATDGLWWWVVPPALCFLALGLALGNRPTLLAVACFTLLVVIPNRAGCDYPGIAGAVFSMLGAALGAGLGRRYFRRDRGEAPAHRGSEASRPSG